MEKISFKTIVEDYEGYIVDFKNGEYIYQNNNDMCFIFEDYDEELAATLYYDLVKEVEYKGLKIAIIQQDEANEPWDEPCKSLEEALEEIAECYGK